MAIEMSVNVREAGPVEQMPLVIAIMEHLSSHGISDYNERQHNSVITAANLIVEELSRPHKPASPGMGIGAWLRCDETGLSSRYMARALTTACNLTSGGMFFGKTTDADGVPCVPHDPSDFARCVAMLDSEPVLRKYIPELASGHGERWKALASLWEFLEALYRLELPTGEAPRLFAALRKILDDNPTQSNTVEIPCENKPGAAS